ncbi:MAG: gliding motility-associated C-terminal domain-containing protein, partial [Bacteroidetes bacterium]|nr:gliding motility-associated C-terminal domain-containing protein [Bacteroidota bacterium]
DTIRFTTQEKTIVSAGPDVSLCEGDSILLTATAVNAPVSAKISYLWNTSDTSQSIYSDARTDKFYWVVASLKDECLSEPDTVFVDVKPSPDAAFHVSRNKSIQPLLSRVHNTSEDWNKATWTLYGNQFDSTFTDNNPSFDLLVNRIGKFRLWLEVENKYNCVDTAWYDSLVIFDNIYIEYWPSAFTPNDDGINDSFSLQLFDLAGIEKLEGKIYNRWGELMHEWVDEDWWTGEFNGRPCPAGVYVYVLKTVDAVGQERIVKGNVTLIR